MNELADVITKKEESRIEEFFKEDEEEPIECSICIEPILKVEDAFKMPNCPHLFHK